MAQQRAFDVFVHKPLQQLASESRGRSAASKELRASCAAALGALRFAAHAAIRCERQSN
jgi:hypothetical protein